MTATCREIIDRIAEFQSNEIYATPSRKSGDRILHALSEKSPGTVDLVRRTVSGESDMEKLQTPSAESVMARITARRPLPWSTHKFDGPEHMPYIARHSDGLGMSREQPFNEPGPPEGQILIYQDGATRLQVRLDGFTVWLTQRLMAELFQVSVPTVNEHLTGIYTDGELTRDATIRNFRIVQHEGTREVSRSVDHYSLDAILAVGYRVRSARGTAFRQWATAQLRELLVKGFVLDDERLKESRSTGADYFDELLERIRAIRASERMFYQKVTDIYATSIDYDPTHPISQTFFATVQNKLHWAIHGRTAAEIIKGRADAAKPHMGLTSWKNAPHGPIRKADVAIAKNYLAHGEITELNRVVSMYLDFAEDQARRKRPMHMAEWVARLDAFLQFNERNILTHAGGISHELAEEHAHAQFEKHEAERRRLEASQPTTDFDKAVEQVKRLEAGEEPKQPETDTQRPGRPARRERKPKRGGDG